MFKIEQYNGTRTEFETLEDALRFGSAMAVKDGNSTTRLWHTSPDLSYATMFWFNRDGTLEIM